MNDKAEDQVKLINELMKTNDYQLYRNRGGILHWPTTNTDERTSTLCKDLGGTPLDVPFVTSSMLNLISCPDCLEWLHA